MPGTDYSKGFTLIELLLAMAISAFVAVVGYQGLSVSIEASRSVRQEAQRLADIGLALSVLEQDISQIIARPVRNELGTLESIMSGGIGSESLLLFTRAGWRNPQQNRRSELARINYAWQDQALVRQRWLSVDRVSYEEGLDEVVLLEGVEQIRVTFFSPFAPTQADADGEPDVLAGRWLDWWDSQRQGLDFDEPLPLAVRVTMTLAGFGEISRVIIIAAA